MILKGKYKYQPTKKEFEVLKRLYMSDKEIAEDMKAPYGTTHSRVLRIFEKLEAKTRAEAVIAAMKLGYIALDDFDC